MNGRGPLDLEVLFFVIVTFSEVIVTFRKAIVTFSRLIVTFRSVIVTILQFDQLSSPPAHKKSRPHTSKGT